MNQSEAVIVDFTSKRPNVYLEFGMALVLGKPIIPITQNLEDIPSNAQSIKCILYHDVRHDDILETKLIPKIEDTINQVEKLNNQSIKIFDNKG